MDTLAGSQKDSWFDRKKVWNFCSLREKFLYDWQHCVTPFIGTLPDSDGSANPGCQNAIGASDERRLTMSYTKQMLLKRTQEI